MLILIPERDANKMAIILITMAKWAAAWGMVVWLYNAFPLFEKISEAFDTVTEAKEDVINIGNVEEINGKPTVTIYNYIFAKGLNDRPYHSYIGKRQPRTEGKDIASGKYGYRIKLNDSRIPGAHAYLKISGKAKTYRDYNTKRRYTKRTGYLYYPTWTVPGAYGYLSYMLAEKGVPLAVLWAIDAFFDFLDYWFIVAAGGLFAVLCLISATFKTAALDQ